MILYGGMLSQNKIIVQILTIYILLTFFSKFDPPAFKGEKIIGPTFANSCKTPTFTFEVVNANIIYKVRIHMKHTFDIVSS